MSGYYFVGTSLWSTEKTICVCYEGRITYDATLGDVSPNCWCRPWWKGCASQYAMDFNFVWVPMGIYGTNKNVFKNEAMLLIIRVGKKTCIVLMKVRLIWLLSKYVIFYVALGLFNMDAVARIISWSMSIELGMDRDYLSSTRPSYCMPVTKLGGSLLCSVRVCTCVTPETCQLPRPFVCVHDVVAVSTGAQNMANYTKREV